MSSEIVDISWIKQAIRSPASQGNLIPGQKPLNGLEPGGLLLVLVLQLPAPPVGLGGGGAARRQLVGEDARHGTRGGGGGGREGVGGEACELGCG